MGKVKYKENPHPALPYNEIGAFMAELRKREGTAPRALEFVILTAAREGETLGAVWDEIDLNTRVWTVPAERMKAGKEHRVPLSDEAVKLLKSLPRTTESKYVFPGITGGRMRPCEKSGYFSSGIEVA